MKRSLLLVGILLFVGVLAAAALAQPQEKASLGWPLGRMYDPKTVENLDGKIESIEKIPAGRTDLPARVTLKLKTAKETVTVYLGPDWYLDQQKAKLDPGDFIHVKGSRVSMDNKTIILPNTITKGSVVMQFWDEKGMPSWRGQGPRGQQK